MSLSPKQLKKKAYELEAAIGKALSSPVRLELLDVLSQGPRTVEALSSEIGQSIANTSQHLQVLRSGRLIESERNGVFITYSIPDAQVLALIGSLHRVGESRIPEVQQLIRSFLEDRDVLEKLNVKSLMQRMRKGKVTLLDVRPAREYQAGHIPGAFSVPLEQLESYLAKLPKNKEIVAYCRGPLCLMSIEAVKLLRHKGFQATRWDQGIVEWVTRGFPLKAGKVA
jgi:rhodanese-related sulfurtransferase/DNA-binding transcriptional ArsR family regulator